MRAFIPVAASFLSILSTVLLVLYRRYKRSLKAFEETFGTFVRKGILFHARARVNHLAAQQLSMRQYCVRAIDAIDPKVTVQLPAERPIRLPIDSIYVPLRLYRGTAEDIPGTLLTTTVERTVLVAGDPGSGKSTLLKILYRDACRRAVLEPRQARLPILIELKTIDWEAIDGELTDDTPALLSELRKRLASVKTAIYEPLELLALSLSSSNTGVLVLFDGLDEIPSVKLDAALRHITQFCQWFRLQSTRNVAILTTRTQVLSVLPRSAVDLFDLHGTIKPFEPSDVYQFLERWPARSESPSDERDNIWKTIADSPSLSEMCTNPLVLSMYVAYYQRQQGDPEGHRDHSGSRRRRYPMEDARLQPIRTRQGRLPSTRVGFYQVVVAELLAFRRHEQLALDVDPNTLLRERESILSEIALDHLYRVTESVNDVAMVDAKNVVMRLQQCSSQEARKRLSELTIQTGVLDFARAGESLFFIHRTFCEYFAAVALVNHGPSEWDRAVEVSRGLKADAGERTRLWEMTVFATAIMPSFMQEKAYADIDEIAEPSLLLRCIREAQSFSSLYFSRAVERLTDALSETADFQDPVLRDEVRRLALTVYEAERSASVTGQRVLIPLRGFWTKLCRSDPELFGSQFSVALEVDPLTAISLSRDFNLSLLPDHIEPLLAVIDRREAFDECVRLAAAPGGDDWRLLLLEGSLRSRVVANALLGRPAIPVGDSGFSEWIARVQRVRAGGDSVRLLDSLWAWFLAKREEHPGASGSEELRQLGIAGPALRQVLLHQGVWPELVHHVFTRSDVAALRLCRIVAVSAGPVALALWLLFATGNQWPFWAVMAMMALMTSARGGSVASSELRKASSSRRRQALALLNLAELADDWLFVGALTVISQEGRRAVLVPPGWRLILVDDTQLEAIRCLSFAGVHTVYIGGSSVRTYGRLRKRPWSLIARVFPVPSFFTVRYGDTVGDPKHSGFSHEPGNLLGLGVDVSYGSEVAQAVLAVKSAQYASVYRGVEEC